MQISTVQGPTEGWLGPALDWCVSLMDTIGAPGAGIGVLLDNLFPPLPSEVILPMAGLAASRRSFTLVEAVLWTTLGSVVGALILYALGAWLGADRLRRLADRMPLVRADDVDRSNAWFERHGNKAVFFGRMIPGFRTFISIPAGVTAMPLGRFALLTMAGSLLWNSLFVLLGWFLGEAWPVVEPYVKFVEIVVVVGALGTIGTFIGLRVRKHLRVRRADASAGGVPLDGDDSEHRASSASVNMPQ